MNNSKSPLIPNFISENIIPPAVLFVGNHQKIKQETVAFIQRQLCQKGGCGTCNRCYQIALQQDYHSLWLKPEKQYKRDDLEPIFHKASFALDEHDYFFFIVEQADMLTSACANSLLKLVEEPPRGYHFIFLTGREQQVLPTIRSRCVVQFFSLEGEVFADSALVNLFKNPATMTPALFLAALEQEKPHEQETMQYLDVLIYFWQQKYCKAITEQEQQQANYADAYMRCLQASLQHQLMPGSSKLFWRNLFLHISLL